MEARVEEGIRSLLGMHVDHVTLEWVESHLYLEKSVKVLTFILDRESDGIVVSYVMGILEELADEVKKKIL